MILEGGCYCGSLRYKVGGEDSFKALCYCHECQRASGGGPVIVLGRPEADFNYTKGTPKAFARDDLENPVTREFCGDCGTPILSRTQKMQGTLVIKVGTLDDPAGFGMPQMAVFTAEKREYHVIPEGVAAFEALPG